MTIKVLLPCPARQVVESSALSFSCYEKGEVTSVEEGHEVECAIPLVRSDVTKDTISVMVKLAKVIDESHDIGQPAAECQLIWLSRRKLVTRR